MQIIRHVLRLSLLAAIAAGCSVLPESVVIEFGDDSSDVNVIVQATFQAMTAAAAMPAVGSTPTAGTGSISGSLNYPAESLPAMYVTAFEVGTQNYQYVMTTDGQQTYQIDGLIPGTYTVVAYTIGGLSFPAGLSGGYTQAVVCGLSQACNDHTLVNVPVAAGQAVSGINPADWYLVDGAFPPFPGPSGAGAAGVTPAALATGSLSGSLMFPSSGIPPMRIVAFEAGGDSHYYVDTVVGQSTYKIEGLPPGTYRVVAYAGAGQAGGYSQMVPCGLKYECDDHSLIDVVVTAGGLTSGVDPTDFYAGPDAFPPNPAP